MHRNMVDPDLLLQLLLVSYSPALAVAWRAARTLIPTLHLELHHTGVWRGSEMSGFMTGFAINMCRAYPRPEVFG